MIKRLCSSALLVALAGCGGGGGSSSPAPVTPPSIPNPPPPLPASVQRSLVQQSLSSTQQGGTIASFGASGGGPLSVARKTAAGERSLRSTSGCVNGVTSSSTPGNAPNVTLLMVNGYSDAACTQLVTATTLTVTNTAPGAGTATGNATSYSPSGAVVEYDTLALTVSGIGSGSGFFSLRDDVSPDSSSAPIANLGVGCSIAPSTDTCSLAAAAHLATSNSDDAAAATVTGTLSSASGGLTNVALSGSGNGVVGALNSTNVVSSGAYQWATTGGSTVDSATVNGSLQYTAAGRVAGGTLSLSDAADAATATVTYTASTQSLTGSVSQSAKPIATFTTNLAGTGTVTYSNGTTGTITNWTVQS